MGMGRFQGVRKRGRGDRALPRTHRAASLAANTRLESIRLANLTHNRLQHNTMRLDDSDYCDHEVTWCALGKPVTTTSAYHNPHSSLGGLGEGPHVTPMEVEGR